MIDPTKLDKLSDDDIGHIVERFNHFTQNWGVNTNAASRQAALKTFLACALDVAMYDLGVEEVPDETWDAFYERVLAVTP